MNNPRLARPLGAAAAPLLAAAALVAPPGANASLTVMRPSPADAAAFYGHGGYSADGLGQSGPGDTVQADVPAGSTVEQAYLYGTYSSPPDAEARRIDFDGRTVGLTQIFDDADTGYGLASARADVTTQVAGKVREGGAPVDFVVGSDPPGLEGVGLVVIYRNPGSPEVSIAILDGGAATAGDAATFDLAAPLDTTVPGFSAKMSLGIGYSYQDDTDGPHRCAGGQTSTVDVNDQRLTSCAGGQDDGYGDNGGLVTVGGVGDSLDDPADPDAADGGTDDELYDLTPFLHDGDTSVTVKTRNASGDDNVFLAVIEVTARASVSRPIAPVNVVAPSVAGTAHVGSTLEAGDGTWLGGGARTYQWQRCTTDGDLTSCEDIAAATASSYVVTTADIDTSLRVAVTLTNHFGSETIASAATARVTAAPVTARPRAPAPARAPERTPEPATTKPTTTTPAQRAPATTPAPPEALPVTMPTGVASAGLDVLDANTAAGPLLSLPLSCPPGGAGCIASGTLSLEVPATARARTAATGSTVLARFSRVRMAAGQRTVVKVRLRASTVASLQRRGIRRARAVLRVDNHAAGAASVRSTQTVVLRIPERPRPRVTRPAPRFTG
jgi:hypothetical protein